MAKKNTLLDRLQQAPTPSSSIEHDRPAPPKPDAPREVVEPTLEYAGPVSLSIEDIKNGIKRFPDLSTIAAEMKASAAKVTSPVTDPHEVWSRLLRSPQGIKLTDPRIHSLSPQRFDAVLLETLKSAFLAGWDARKGVEK